MPYKPSYKENPKQWFAMRSKLIKEGKWKYSGKTNNEKAENNAKRISAIFNPESGDSADSGNSGKSFFIFSDGH